MDEVQVARSTDLELHARKPRPDPGFYAQAFLAGYSRRTREAYTCDLKQWGQWCAEHQVDVLDVGRAHLQVWIRDLEQLGRAPSTIGRKLSAVGGFYGYCVVEEILLKNPAAHLRRPKVSQDSPRLGLDRPELHQLIGAAQAHSPQAHALILLLALNGLRVSEATSCHGSDLTHDHGHELLAITRKGGKRARVPLAPPVFAAIDALHRQPDELLIGLNRYGAWRLVTRLVDAAGITKTISPHSLRHSFCTLALDAGAALRDVQDAMGHADPRTTRRYDRDRGALDRHATYTVATYLQTDQPDQ